MRLINFRSASQLFFVAGLLVFPAAFAGAPVPQSPPNIGVSGNLSGNEVRRGRPARAVVVMEIPSGFHVNSNRPLEKFLIPTQLQIEAPSGVRVGVVSYPRAALRKLKFSKNRVSVFEGRATMRFSVTVPAGFNADSTELKARLKYQPCNDEVCFPPATREVTIPVSIK